MAYQSHHCFATLPCSIYLTIFLHTCLALSILLPFMLYAPCPFNAPFLFCVFQLLHTTSFYTPESLSTTTLISSLFCILIVSVHLAHTICTMLLHALHPAIVLHIGIFTATPHYHHFTPSSINTVSMFCMFSSCRVLFLIIMEIPHLFCRLYPCVHHHWVLC
jgi:hypothetical protein